MSMPSSRVLPTPWMLRMVILPSKALKIASAVVVPSRLVRRMAAIEVGRVSAGIVHTTVPSAMGSVSFLALTMTWPCVGELV